MSYTLTIESFDSIISFWGKLRLCLKWDTIFVLPAWLKVWWEAFGGEAELYLRILWQGKKPIGFVPLQVTNETASFIGCADVCDYLDFVIAPGREQYFFKALLADLRWKGIKKLDLRLLRYDSTTLTQLVSIAQSRGYEVLCHPEDVSLELDLPPTWNEYLTMLKAKHRHEVRRKLRRLWETGSAEHSCIEIGWEVEDALDIFFRLFSLSRDEKASFMNPKMESFFRSLAKAMAEIGLLRFGILKLDKIPAAMTMGFDYNGAHYLYNSAYNPQYNYLSLGVLCKVLCLKESIEKGRKKWNFLKGAEPYKYQLGGQEVPLYCCQIIIT